MESAAPASRGGILAREERDAETREPGRDVDAAAVAEVEVEERAVEIAHVDA